jgi:hypothetical protein
VPNGLFVFAAIFALVHTAKNAKFPVVGRRKRSNEGKLSGGLSLRRKIKKRHIF